MNKKSSKKTNYSIDSFRMIAALLIIFSHSTLAFYDYHTPSGLVYFVIMWFMRLAVPLFFVVSGYFSFSKTDNSHKMLKSAFDMIIMFLKIEAVFFVLHIICKQGIKPVVETLTMDSFFNMIVYNESVFNRTLWFVLVLIYVKIIYAIAQKVPIKNIEFWCLITAFVMWFIGGPLSLTYEMTGGNYIFGPNLFAIGWLYFTIGRCIGKYQDSVLGAFSNKDYVKYLIGAAVLYLSEYWIVVLRRGMTLDSYIMMPIFCALILIFMLNNPSLGKGTVLPEWGKKYSFVLYLWHPAFLEIIKTFVFAGWDFNKGLKTHLTFATVVTILTIVSCEIYFRIVKIIASRNKSLVSDVIKKKF